MYGATKPPAHASHYSPKFVPGARLPHVWISFPDQPSSASEVARRSSLPRKPVDVSYIKEIDQEQVRACQWSTLDLCGPESWTLILGQEQEIPHITRLQEHCNIVGVPLHIWRPGADFQIVRQSWFADELANGGGVLIRPDQHILARVSTETNGEDLVVEVNKHLGISKC